MSRLEVAWTPVFPAPRPGTNCIQHLGDEIGWRLPCRRTFAREKIIALPGSEVVASRLLCVVTAVSESVAAHLLNRRSRQPASQARLTAVISTFMSNGEAGSPRRWITARKLPSDARKPRCRRQPAMVQLPVIASVEGGSTAEDAAATRRRRARKPENSKPVSAPARACGSRGWRRRTGRRHPVSSSDGTVSIRADTVCRKGMSPDDANRPENDGGVK